VRDAVQQAMDDARLDALVYPTWAFPPRLIGDLNTPHGNNSPRLSPPTGFPAITVPMGFVRDTLPVGLQVFGRAWSEPTLIKIVYGHDRPPGPGRPPGPAPPLWGPLRACPPQTLPSRALGICGPPARRRMITPHRRRWAARGCAHNRSFGHRSMSSLIGIAGT